MELRGKALKRIAHLYALLERQEALNLRKSICAVARVEKAMGLEDSLAEGARSQREQALLQGDQPERVLAAIQSAMVQQRRAVLETVLATREEEERLARTKHATSKVKRDQTDELLKTATNEARSLEERKLQAMTDDRFSSFGRSSLIARRPGEGSLNTE